MKNKNNEKKIGIKLLLCSIYLIVITILSIVSYKVYMKKIESIKPWTEVTNSDEYSYIKVSRMSERFAYYDTSKKSIHFVIEEEETGAWHTYLIAIKEGDYSKYSDIIDYTYERTTKVPKPIKVYGYPVLINDELKKMAIKNIINFLPVENEIKITEENFDTYLTNSYLDTTIEEEKEFNLILFISLLIIVIMIILFITTIFYKEKPKEDLEEFVSYFRKKNSNKINKRGI